MPMDMILTNNANIKIKEVIRGNKIILECEDKTEYYCPKCGSYHLRCKDTFIRSYHLRCKDTFIRNIKNISIGEKASILRFKTHKYCCKDCGSYFNSTPQGLLKYQQTMESLKREVFHKHCEGVSKKDLSQDFGVSDSSIERWFQQGYVRKNKELQNAMCPMVLGIDEHYFSKIFPRKNVMPQH